MRFLDLGDDMGLTLSEKECREVVSLGIVVTGGSHSVVLQMGDGGSYVSIRRDMTAHYANNIRKEIVKKINGFVSDDAPGSQLPDDLAEQFEPYDSHDVNGNRYLAVPRFVGLLDNEISEGSLPADCRAEDGSRWRIQRMSPTRDSQGDNGSYLVVFCRLV